MRLVPNVNMHIFKQPNLPWQKTDVFIGWENIDLDSFSVEEPDGFDGGSGGGGGYLDNAKTIGTFSLTAGQFVQFKFDEIHDQSESGSKNWHLFSASQGVLTQTPVVGNQNNQTESLENDSGMDLDDLVLRIELSGFASSITVKIRNTVINVL